MVIFQSYIDKIMNLYDKQEEFLYFFNDYDIELLFGSIINKNLE